MDFLTMSALANAGFTVVGAFVDSKAASRQAGIEKLATDVNATSQKVQVAKQYNSLFEKQVEDLSTQKSILAGLSIDKSSSFFGEALRKQEKAFLGSQKSMQEDFKNIDTQSTLDKINISMKKSQAKSNAIMGAGMNLASIGLDFYGKKYGGVK